MPAGVRERAGRSGLIRNAIGLVSSTFQLGALAGPLLAGALIGAAGNGIAFAVNAASYGGSITALLLVLAAELRHTRGNNRPAGRVRLRDGLLRRAHSRVR